MEAKLVLTQLESHLSQFLLYMLQQIKQRSQLSSSHCFHYTDQSGRTGPYGLTVVSMQLGDDNGTIFSAGTGDA